MSSEDIKLFHLTFFCFRKRTVDLKQDIGTGQTLFQLKPVNFGWKFTFVGEGKTNICLPDFSVVGVDCGLQGPKNSQ